MHSKWAAIIGAAFTIGLFVLTNAKRAADAVSIIHLPHDLGEFLTAMSGAPALVSNGALGVGIICLAYLIHSAWRAQAPIVKPQALQQPDKPKTVFNAVALPPANYSRAQINKIVATIDALYPDTAGIEHALGAGQELVKLVAGVKDHKSAAACLRSMKAFREAVLDASAKFDATFKNHRLYREACNVVAEKPLHHGPFENSYIELRDMLHDIPDRLTTPTTYTLVRAKKETFAARISDYLQWATSKKNALSEYREFYLRRPTTD